MLAGLQELLLNVLFPRRCADCGAVGAWVCVKCCDQTASNILNFEIFELATGLSVISLLPYRAPVVRELLHYLKYESITEAAASLLHIAMSAPAAAGLARLIPSQTLCIPIPLSYKRLRKRGYNQAELLAKSLERYIKLPIDVQSLVRVERRTQVGASRAARFTNLEGAFSLQKRVMSNRVLLIDDLCTTGATLQAAAEPLLRAGIEVMGLTIARVNTKEAFN